MNTAQQKITVTVGDISIQMPAQTILKNVLAELTGTAKPANVAPATDTPAIGQEWPEYGGVFAGIMRISVTTSNKNGENEVHSGFKLPRFSSAQKLAQSLRGLADHIEKRQG